MNTEKITSSVEPSRIGWVSQQQKAAESILRITEEVFGLEEGRLDKRLDTHHLKHVLFVSIYQFRRHLNYLRKKGAARFFGYADPTHLNHPIIRYKELYMSDPDYRKRCDEVENRVVDMINTLREEQMKPILNINFAKSLNQTQEAQIQAIKD